MKIKSDSFSNRRLSKILEGLGRPTNCIASANEAVRDVAGTQTAKLHLPFAAKAVNEIPGIMEDYQPDTVPKTMYSMQGQNTLVGACVVFAFDVKEASGVNVADATVKQKASSSASVFDPFAQG